MKPEKRDMALMNRLYAFNGRSGENIPLSFTYGCEKISGLPCAELEITRPDSNLTVYTLTACLRGLKVTYEQREYRDYPVVEFFAKFTYEGDGMSEILGYPRAFDGIIPMNNAVLEWSNGDTCTEEGYEITETTLTESFTLSPWDGTSCKGAWPYIRLIGDDMCVNIAVGWTGKWETVFVPDEGGVRLSAGQKLFNSRLLPGETAVTPRITLMAAAGGRERVRNLWRRWYVDHILPRENGKPLPPKLCLHNMNIGGTDEFTGITTKNQLLGIDEYIRRGLKPDLWWIDAGWYPCGQELAEDGVWRGGSWPQTGTWKADERRMPGGMGDIGSKCEENDIGLLVWFEPERVHPGTWLDVEHPEWLLYADGNREDGGSRLLNLGNPEAWKWLTDHVNGLIKDYRISVYRQDFNFDPWNKWTGGDSEEQERIGITENLHIQGYMNYFDALILANPGLWIDSCASGGRRNDLETMRRAVPLHYTDVGYGNHPVKQKQYRLLNEWIPYYRSHTWSWDNDEGTYEPRAGRPVDEFTYLHSIAPSITSMVTYDAPDEEMELALSMEPIWRRMARIMLAGDYTPLTPCRKLPEDVYAEQFWDEEHNEGFVRIIANPRFSGSVTLYPVYEEGEVYGLQNAVDRKLRMIPADKLADGITLSPEPRSAQVWFYNKIK